MVANSTQSKEKRRHQFVKDNNMKDNKSTMRKTIGWVSLAYGAFTAISIIGPPFLERVWSRRK